MRIALLSVVLMILSAAQPSMASIAVRHILLSTNDLADLGLPPVEGEILYDMPTGKIMARIGGADVLLPQGGSVQVASSGATSEEVLGYPGLRTILLGKSDVAGPVEGELAHDTVLQRPVIWRAGAWRTLGQARLSPQLESQSQSQVAGGLYRHVLPDVTTVTLQDGELAVDYVNQTVLFKSGSSIVDLKTGVRK